jgi:S1/P1 Nuclease
VDRIVIFQCTLGDSQAPVSSRTEALKFLVHMVADIHQPMHAIGEARSGNDIHVLEFGSATCGSRACNLHSVWDLGLIQHERLSDGNYVAQRERMVTQEGLETKPLGTPEEWANESFHLAHRVWLRDGSSVDEGYYQRCIQSLNQQLALAGIRLARLLNQALCD